jgi:predicted DNA-binding transcriptional regulator YafY
MRASRLISILTTLQAKGRVTAGALAADCEVSVRTIYRDVEALGAAGVPIYSDRGPDGGYRLLESYRTRLNGLSQAEAEALFLSGLPDAAAELGLGEIMAAAQLKLLAALPADLRRSADAMRSRFLFDAPAWFSEAEHPQHLRSVASALWNERVLRIRYRSWKDVVERTVEPLGLVLKANAWYMAGRVGADVRVYRVAQILHLEVLATRFVRPAQFDLDAFWRASQQRFERELYSEHAVVQVTPLGLRRLRMLGGAFAKAADAAASAPERNGWRVVELPIESVRHASIELLRLGAEVVVLAPSELRRSLAETARTMHRLYEEDPAKLGEAMQRPQRPAPARGS